MKKSILFTVLMTLFLLLPLYSFAGEDGTVSGKASVAVSTLEDERESAKFQEYREVPDGISGSTELRYKKNDYFLEVTADKISQDDQYLNLRTGFYGKYRIEISYDRIPHRFAFDAKTLYSGVGTGRLILSDRIQSDLQNTASSTALARKLDDYFAGSFTTDLELLRKKGTANIDLMALDPFNLRVEFSREKREGARPFFGSFGFGNAIEIAEPIDYNTTDIKVIAEYTKRPLYLNLTFYSSEFDNNTGTLTFDNPFRVSDSTTATAYTATFAAGPSKGLIDLYPDNSYQSISFTGSLMDLPLKSRLSATAALGWLRQDDNFVPYTINTAIKKGAVSGIAGVPVPINAFDVSSLPKASPDAKVDTTLVNLLLTSKPISILRVKGKYRFYEYDNNTDIISFPGHVRFDAVWEPEHEDNVPTSYKKHTAGIDLGFDLFKATTLTLGYTFENTERKNREVEDQDENIYRVALDTKPLSWLDLRLAYERSERRGDYNYLIPFVATHITSPEEAGEVAAGTEPVAQIPFLRKYDEAERDRDRVQLIASVYPIEPLTLTGQIIYGRDDFKDSAFGLLDDKHEIYSIDADYSISDRWNIFAFYSYEKYKNSQKARQWTPGSLGDPFLKEKGLNSNSNWNADNEDIVNTVGGGLNIAFMPKKLDFKLTYSYSETDGKVKLLSPLGTSATDSNPFVPAEFSDVDDVKLQTLDAKVKYRIMKGLSIALGYMWERFDISDFENRGFTYIPTTATGDYNGALLMGTLPKDYNVNILYAKLSYNF